jgi:hypothetical protein
MNRADHYLNRIQTQQLMILKAQCNKPVPTKRIQQQTENLKALIKQAQAEGATPMEIEAAQDMKWR